MVFFLAAFFEGGIGFLTSHLLFYFATVLYSSVVCRHAWSQCGKIPGIPKQAAEIRGAGCGFKQTNGGCRDMC